mmetsp:Transcript_6039/g.10092  ORF Transcript_6039/g.10092 Transcript_6039/m.10092 type:complete len:216 (-) Transcript_6039:64-711(-)
MSDIRFSNSLSSRSRSAAATCASSGNGASACSCAGDPHSAGRVLVESPEVEQLLSSDSVREISDVRRLRRIALAQRRCGFFRIDMAFMGESFGRAIERDSKGEGNCRAGDSDTNCALCTGFEWRRFIRGDAGLEWRRTIGGEIVVTLVFWRAAPGRKLQGSEWRRGSPPPSTSGKEERRSLGDMTRSLGDITGLPASSATIGPPSRGRRREMTSS